MKFIAIFIAVILCFLFIMSDISANGTETSETYAKAQATIFLLRECMRSCKRTAQDAAAQADCITNCVKKYPLRARNCIE